MKKQYNLSPLLKLCLSLTLALFLSHLSHAQAPVLKWSDAFKSSDCFVNVDKLGNVYVSGQYDTSTIIQNDTLVCKPGYNGNNHFISKYDATGKLLWAKNISKAPVIYISNLQANSPGGIFPDNKGGVYLLCSSLYADSIVLPPFKIKCTRFLNSFITYINPSGAFAWVLPIHGSTGFNMGGVDNDGNLYAQGSFNHDSLTIDKYGFVNYNFGHSTNDLFALKINSTGKVLWAKQFGSNADDSYNFYGHKSSYVDAKGNFYQYFMSGTDTFNVDTAKIIFRPHPWYLANYASLMKIDPNGNFTFIKDSFQETRFLTTDHHGHMYFITNNRYTNDTIGGIPTTGNNVFLVKCDSNFNSIWVKGLHHHISKAAGIYQLLVDDNGNVYFMSKYNSTNAPDSSDVCGKMYKNYGYQSYGLTHSTVNSFVTRLDQNGNFKWTQQVGGERDDEINQYSALDRDGNIYFGGYLTSDTFHIGNKIIYFKKNHYQGFIGKLDTSGNLVWEYHTNGANHDNVISEMVVDPLNNVYVTGTFNSDSVHYSNNLILNAYRYGNNSFIIKLEDTAVHLSTSTNNIVLNHSLVIYPNPADAYITIHAQSDIQAIELIDQMGRNVKREYPSDATNINISLSGINAGMYLLRIQSDNQWVTKKIIKLSN